MRRSSSSSSSKKIPWSVFDMVRPFPPTPSPETLMADIDAAIAASELASSNQNSQQKQTQYNQNLISDDDRNDVHDARVADEAYKAACAALASGRHDAAARSLRVAIASCPPDKTSAMSKLRSLMAIAESQLKQQQKS